MIEALSIDGREVYPRIRVQEDVVDDGSVRFIADTLMDGEWKYAELDNRGWITDLEKFKKEADDIFSEYYEAQQLRKKGWFRLNKHTLRRIDGTEEAEG